MLIIEPSQIIACMKVAYINYVANSGHDFRNLCTIQIHINVVDICAYI